MAAWRSRLAMGFALLLVASLSGAAPVSASPRLAAPTTAVVERHPGHATGRPDNATRRGHVRVDRLPAGGTVSGSAGPTRLDGPVQLNGSVTGIESLPQVDLATTSSTPAPALVKIPAGVGGASSPNPLVAAGPDHIAWSDGGRLTFSDRSGNGTYAVTFRDFFLVPPLAVNGFGQIFYDSLHGRWMAIEESHDCQATGGAQYGHGYLEFAVSDSANPTLGWTIYYYTYTDAIIYFPGLGSSADQIVLTSEVYEMDGGCSSGGVPPAWEVTGIRWTDLIAGTFNESYFVFAPTDDDRVESMTPIVRNSGESTTLEVVVSYLIYTPMSREQWLLRITGSGPGASGQLSQLPVPLFGDTLQIPQGTVDIFPTPGLTGGVSTDGRVVLSLTESCTPAGDTIARNCARIIDLDTSDATLARNQDFYLGKKGVDTFTPGIAFAATGDLIITFQRASATTGPSAYVVRQASTDASATVSAQRTLAVGDGYYQGLGAYQLGLQPDPLVPDAVWVINTATVGEPPYLYGLHIAQARTATGDTYVPIEPLRVLDTRTGTGLSGPFATGVPRTISIAGAGGGTIPEEAVAITGNVTVALQGSPGYVALGPSLGSNPSTSTLNFPLGDNRANNLTLPLDAAGDINAVFKGAAGKSTQLILDVTGYFVADDTGATYQPVTSTRILDTRGAGPGGKLTSNVPKTFQVTGLAGVPAGATAVTGNLTVVNQTRGGYVALTPEPVTNPTTSTLNFPLGDVRANGVTAPLSDTGSLSAVFKSATVGTTDLVFDVTGYYQAGTAGLRFYPLNPGRLMDTRSNVLTQLSGPFTSSVARTLVTGGHFGVPGNALAVTGNLTVVGQQAPGYVGITKNPTPNPPVSTLNFPLGDTRANGATVPLNGANDMALTYKASSGAKTHLIFDVTGYFR
jgi:hypothetical protein